MGIQHLGENLIFLISQPRAGSTLLQRILGNHPQIHTISEPWIMLHPLYTLRENGYWFDYDGHVAWLARSEFFRSLPDGEDDYYDALRRMYVHLYNQTLLHSGKKIVLDKTPRYYNIIPELKQLFPKAHFIILFRNPIAVLSSISKTWIKGSWMLLHRYKQDLLKAPKLLLEGIELLDGSCTVISYERLVKDPDAAIKKICNNLDLEFTENTIEYGTFDDRTWLHGDKSKITQFRKPDPLNVDKWIENIKDPQSWRLANDYLSLLGKDSVTQMGYSFIDIQEILDNVKPNSIRLWFTFPMLLYLNLLDFTVPFMNFEHRVDRVIELLRDVGLTTTAKKIFGEIKQIRNTRKKGS